MARDHSPAPDVFISYAGLDRDVAGAIAAALEAAGVRAWWDALLTGHEPFERHIQRILTDAKVIVAVLSPQSLASEWVRWELAQASQNGLHIVPLLVKHAGAAQLPPPLHLLPSLSIDGGAAEPMDDIAEQIRVIVERINRRPGRPAENDARRRLASAAAQIARDAARIKHRRSRPHPTPSLMVHGGHLEDEAPEVAARFSLSDEFAAFLHEQRLSLALTSSQTGELFLIGRAATGAVTVDVQAFRRPTGLHVAGGTLLLGTLAHLYRLENILRPTQSLDGVYSHCYVPRLSVLTGIVDTHDVALTGSGEAVFVATRYNCLAAVSPVHSFRPVWRPPFISAIVAEDRCHLNGLAMRDGKPAYATALARSDTYDGWRDELAGGGIVLDVQTGAIVCDGLSMPHSPRVHEDALWVLNSGAGTLGIIEAVEGGGTYRPIAFCPGFTRGLAFHGPYAIVGLSRPRYDSFAGLPLDARLRYAGEDPWCGIQIVDTRSGRCIHSLRIDGPTMEISDVAVLPDVECPRSVSVLDDGALDLVTVEESGDQSG